MFRIAFLLTIVVLFSNQSFATRWCDLPKDHRTECRFFNSPLRSHPGNCPPAEEMYDCESHAKLCLNVNYNQIGWAFDDLERQLTDIISANPNDPYIEFSPFPGRQPAKVKKPIRLPAAKDLKQVGQQEYVTCLIVETRK